jgi:hypothetical protein
MCKKKVRRHWGMTFRVASVELLHLIQVLSVMNVATTCGQRYILKIM